ncbi:hypothetical protein DL766_003483 [Monosporascus sp. MC13-8B]|uniref:Invertebrate defensins family profile domain-containing protein n=1 Tax=Monosporascus cannonballus TaxID=155416 RepID=A0ABY0HIR6_9PEZI|nr:hypothetical protein DL763_011567 [Monosporascus cannonballus]RYO91526.1 hypothetical protein DL762_002140 [Monosporascus cannonballus]RYP33420.1 hypothetical protein DL766_003483 [Monosporascus sp. MC13-8B]
MQPKTILITLFIAVAAAFPSPQDAVQDVVQDKVTNPSASGDVSIMAQKNWQAKGGCKTDWDEDRRCLKTCIGEAETGKCRNWKSMTAVIQGGCVFAWRTCRCICEY